MVQVRFVSCELCGSTRYEPFLSRGDLSLFIPGTFHLVRCLDCGLVFLNPRPDSSNISDIYPDEYDQYTVIASEEKSPLARWARMYGLNKRAKPILSRKKTGRLLDIGCATGDFLEQMKMLGGWELYGIEVNKLASQYASKKLGIPVVNSELEEAGYPGNYFDVVTMWNVIEHLPNPMKTLTEISRILKPDGIFVFNTPVIDSLDAKVFGKYWIGYELPRHFYVFSMSTISRMVEQAGFHKEQVQCLYGSHAMVMSSIRFFLRDKFPGRIERIITRFILSLPFRILMSPYFFLADHLNWSTAPTLVCVKKCN